MKTNSNFSDICEIDTILQEINYTYDSISFVNLIPDNLKIVLISGKITINIDKTKNIFVYFNNKYFQLFD